MTRSSPGVRGWTCWSTPPGCGARSAITTPAARFHIDGVTGPDEYSALADDNVYTNLMARRNLLAAADAAKQYPERARELGVSDEESAGWRDAAQAMTVPFDQTLGVHAQAEGFTRHQAWDFARTAAGQYPLMLHFPYFDLYRKQVVKQADLVLAMHLCGSAFTPEQKARNFDYYERLTVRDSSLSACTQAAIAAEVGHLDLAYDYLGEAALMDLRDLEHNTRDGVHIASLASTWVALVSGFGGLRGIDGTFSFAPRLPRGLTRLAFTLFIRGRRLRVEITHAEATYSLARRRPARDLAPRPAGDPHGRETANPAHPARTVPAPAQPAARTRASPPRAHWEPGLATELAPGCCSSTCQCARLRAGAYGAEVAIVRRASRTTVAPSNPRPARAQISRHSSPRAIPWSPKYWTPRSADNAAPCGITGFRPE